MSPPHSLEGQGGMTHAPGEVATVAMLPPSVLIVQQSRLPNVVKNSVFLHPQALPGIQRQGISEPREECPNSI